MPYKSWGTTVPFEKYFEIKLTDSVPAGKQIGIYGYQPIAATLSSADLYTLRNFNLATLVNAIQTAIPGEVMYMVMSWNEPGGTQVTDLVLGLVFHNTQDLNGVQQILNTIFATSIGIVLTECYMNQLNAWTAYRLNESPPLNWPLIGGVSIALILGVGALAHAARRR